MYRAFRLCLLFLLSSLSVSAQKEVNMWYFGYNAGINFNTTPASILTDGQTYTREGVATICDGATGQLLFYTEGTTVWNAKHQVMPNGTGLRGDPSSVQSAIAVPFPGHPGQYYVFTTMTDKGLHYSLLDMALDNGKGDINPATKNTMLLGYSMSTEKMAATRHCNGKDYWLVTHAANSADYYVYLITSAGISAPTIYTTGVTIHPGGWEEAGYIKFSDDGGTIVHSMCSLQHGKMSKVDLLKFNNTTGAISAPFNSLDVIFPIGVEFSSNGKLLYVVSMNYSGGSLVWSVIYQYDLTAPDVNASQITVASVANPLQIGGIQMGPDRRIYIGYEKGNGYRYVGLIHQSDVRGLGCNFEQDGMDMDPTGQGLRKTSVCFPTFVNSFLYVPADFTVSNICGGTPTFKMVNETGVTNVLWDFGDGTTSTDLSPQHIYASEKTYTVKLTVTQKCSTDEKVQQITISRSTQEAVSKNICSGDSYTLPDGKSVSTAGTYVSTLKRKNNSCDSVITTTLTVLPVYHLKEDITICNGQEYQLADGRKVRASGTYVASAKTYQGCDSIVTTTLKVLPTDFQVTAAFCQGSNYQLPDGRVVDKAATYRSVFTSSMGCDSIITTVLSMKPAYNNREEINICDGDSYKLPDGRIVNTAGLYTSRFATYLGCDSIIVSQVNIHPHYAISKDVRVCSNTPYTLPDGRVVSRSGTYVSPLHTYVGCDSIITTQLTVLPSYSKEVYDTVCNGRPYTLPDGRQVFAANTYTSRLFSILGCDSIITTYLFLKQKPLVTMEPEVCLFAGQPVTITLQPGYDKYIWEDGVIGNVHVLRYPGVYRVNVMNECGTTTLQTVAKDCMADLFLPTAFTPNGDGQNDIFRLRTPHGQTLLEFRIFNRWGMEVFYTTDLLQGWDGTFKGAPQPLGSYVYFVRYKNVEGIEKQLKGAVHLLR